MIIYSSAETMVGVEPKRVKLKLGKNNVDIDYKDPRVERQLEILRKLNVAMFQERLSCDIERSKKDKEAVDRAKRSDGDNLGSGAVQDQACDESSGCSEISERRDCYDQAVKVRRTRRKKKPTVGETDQEGA